MSIMESEIRNNSIITEAVTEMMMDQEPAQRIGYVKYAMEAMVKPEGQNTMLDKLYKDVSKIEGVDFGRIPDSKGDITKYQYYEQMYDSLELLNKLCEGEKTANLITANKLHQILLDATPDFVLGFRFNDFVVTSTYKCMVAALYEMINICIVDATSHLRKKLSGKPPMKPNDVRMMTKNVNSFIKLYENGQWNLIVKHLKQNGKVIAEESVVSFSKDEDGNSFLASLAMEDTFVRKIVDNAVDAQKVGKNVYDSTKTFIKETPAKLGTMYSNANTKHPILTKGATFIAGLIALLIIIRKAFKLYFKGAAKIKESVQNEAEILKANIANDADQTTDAVEKQRNLLERMEKVSDVIEYKVLKTEKEAQKELAEDNRRDFSGNEIRTLVPGSDFSF